MHSPGERMHGLPYWRLSGYYFFYFAFNGAFTPFFGLYLLSVGFSAWDISLLMAVQQVMRLVAPSLWGWLADAGHSRISIVRLAALASASGFFLFLFVRDFSGMLLAMAVLAFFWSAALPLVETLTFNHLRESTGHYGRIRLWGSIGFIVAVFGTGVLLDHLPQMGLLWICLVFLGGIVLMAQAIPEAAPAAVSKASTRLPELLAQPRVRALFAACFMMSVAHGALYVFYSIHLAGHGYGSTGVGSLWSLGVLAEILLFVAMPRLLRRFSLRSILIASYAAAVIRFLLIGWCIDSPVVVFLAQCLHGLTFGTWHAASISAVNLWFPGKAQARGQAFYSSVSFGAGGLVGALASGWTWELGGGEWTFTMAAMFALGGLILTLRGFPSCPRC